MQMYIILVILLLLYLTQPQHIKYPVNNQKKRVVCTLTTRPKQPYYFSEVLESLVAQFDAVYLTLPAVSRKGEKYPPLSFPGVTIVNVEKDYGPITKFMGGLIAERNPNTVIVAVDDDIVYSPNLRKQYEEHHRKYPEYALSGAGIVYKYCVGSAILSMTGKCPSFPCFIPSLVGNKELMTVCGYTGICFRKGLVDKDELIGFIDTNCTDIECIKNDDIVFSAFLASRGIKRLAVSVDNSQVKNDKDTESLSAGNPLSADSIYNTQYNVFLKLQPFFKNNRFRVDCICPMDVLLVLLFYVMRSLMGKLRSL